MYIRSLTISGLADLPHFSIDALNRSVRIQGPSLAATAVGDGLALAFAALSEPTMRRLLLRWGLISSVDEAEVFVESTPTQANWTDRQIAKSLVSDHKKRKIKVGLSILLDPLLCAQLRQQAGAEPRLSLGLGRDHTLKLEVSAFFGASWDILSIAIMSVVIDGERFPTGINERAPWMANLLTTLGERFVSHDESDSHPALALACLCSPKADTFAQYTRWTRLLSPEIDALRVAKAGENTAIFIAGNRPLSRFGPRAVRAAEWAATAAMGGADVMWMGSHDERAEQLVLGDACALEQLWTVCPQGEIRPQPGDGPKSVLPLAKI
jgi:hypothetical protein